MNGESSEKRAFEVFSHNQQFRKNLYNLLQELRSINFVYSSKQFTTIFQKMNLKYPVLRNQAIRIDFLQEPQFLQGMYPHQDVRGMRSSNCLNFWIPLQDVNDKIGTWPYIRKVIEMEELNQKKQMNLDIKFLQIKKLQNITGYA